VIPLAINNVSAFSKPSPAATPTIIRSWSSLRRTTTVARRGRQRAGGRGLQPVWKDWDSWLGRASQCHDVLQRLKFSRLHER
jgi:2-iminoacetate synthase